MPSEQHVVLHKYALSCAVPAGFPRIVQGPSSVSVERGQLTIVPCSATGDPQPTITWYKNLVPLNMSDTRLQLLSNGMLHCSTAGLGSTTGSAPDYDPR